jgi:hypothetical protein
VSRPASFPVLITKGLHPTRGLLVFEPLKYHLERIASQGPSAALLLDAIATVMFITLFGTTDLGTHGDSLQLIYPLAKDPISSRCHREMNIKRAADDPSET